MKNSLIVNVLRIKKNYLTQYILIFIDCNDKNSSWKRDLLFQTNNLYRLYCKYLKISLKN